MQVFRRHSVYVFGDLVFAFAFLVIQSEFAFQTAIYAVKQTMSSLELIGR